MTPTMKEYKKKVEMSSKTIFVFRKYVESGYTNSPCLAPCSIKTVKKLTKLKVQRPVQSTVRHNS